MTISANILRIVVASPGDVQAERDVLPAVIEELNGGVARDRGIRLELSRWETDAHPGFHPEGPQGLIDQLLRIEDCDLLLGIFWKRFGTPTMDAQSGAEHEFRTAYAAWQQRGCPQIMVYFNQRSATPQTVDEIDQWRQVLQFRQDFPKEGLWWPYRGKVQFERQARRHLTQFIREQPPLNASRNSLQRQNVEAAAIMGSRPTPEVAAGLREAYLNRLIEEVRGVPLASVDPPSVQEETRRDLDLAAVYTALMTQRTEEIVAREMRPDREQRRLSALAMLNGEPHLALLGEPGCGKSTFVNFVTLCLAGELLGLDDANLKTLIAPLPHDRQGDSARDQEQAQPWDRGPLMPVLVELRDFVARGLPSGVEGAEVDGDTLWQFISAELPSTLKDFAGPLRDELLTTGGLLLLDGLDEVPEAQLRREQVKAAVEGFAATFPKVVVLVTSRTYAYQRQDWKLRGFAEAVLAPFEEAQITSFVERWYAFVGQARGLTPEDARGRAALLNGAIDRNPRLYELATRPLLLALMASLHAWRGGTLPEQREELYAHAVELLLRRWEDQKLRRRPDGTFEVIEPRLAEWLQTDQKAMRTLLNRLAFEAHRDQLELLGTADIPQDTLVNGLMGLNLNPDARPGRLVEYLRDRAGLLIPRADGIYAFSHRTFQEYLAACHLTEQDDFPDNIADLLRGEPNRWREATLLAGAKAASGAAAMAWNLAEALCYEEPPGERAEEEAGRWGALLAAQALVENRLLERIAGRNLPKVERIRGWLTCCITQEALPPVDRAQAGHALAVVGDPRFRADAWQLPDEPPLGFVEIPAGPFLMGSDKGRDPEAYDVELPQHEVSLPRYYMARYPVTVGQFRAFVEESGYQPADEGSLDGLPNCPVVDVSWHDALAYCVWLTERLREWKGTPEPLATLLRRQGWKISLPSEAEWEKAARGTDGRIYPWGNEYEPDRANSYEIGIGAASAVGAFPSAASPYGCLDLAGNVWEWTRSLSEEDFNYPYDPDDGREDLGDSDNVARVLRGGSYFFDHRNVRCARRLWNNPSDFNWLIGFRVAVLPSL